MGIIPEFVDQELEYIIHKGTNGIIKKCCYLSKRAGWKDRVPQGDEILPFHSTESFFLNLEITFYILFQIMEIT